MRKQAQLTGTEHDRVVHAREVMGLWSKARQALRLYAPGHPSAQTALERFAARARSALSLSGSLRFAITDAALLVDGEPVTARDAPSEENVARRLFRGGIRELMLDVAASQDECQRLGLLLHTLLDQDGLDPATALSRAELAHVGWQAMNILAEAWEVPEWLSKDALGTLEEMNRDVDALVSGLEAQGAAELLRFELSDGASEAQEVGQVELEESHALWDLDVFPVAQADKDALRQEVGAWGPDRLLRFLVDAALDGLAYAPAELGRETVAWALRQAFENALAARDLRLVRELLVRLRQELDLLEDERDEVLLREVDAWLGTGERLERLVEVALAGGVGGGEALCGILELLGPLGTEAAVATFSRATEKELEERLLRHLAAHASDRLDLLEWLIDPAGRASKVRSVLFMVSKTVKEPAALDKLLRRGCEHHDEQVKGYAEHLWRTLTPRGRLTGAREALKAPARDARLAAIRSVVEAGDTEAVHTLLQQGDDPGFLDKDKEERQAVVEALAALGGSRVADWLEGWATRSAWVVFKRDAVKETKELCQRAHAAMLERRRTGKVTRPLPRPDGPAKGDSQRLPKLDKRP